MSDTVGTMGARTTPARGIVITKFSIMAFCLQAMIALAMLVGFWSAALNPSGFTHMAIFEDRIWWIVALFFTPVLLWVEGVVLRQIFFHRRRAVWIEDGHLKIIDFQRVRARSLAIDDIRELSIGSVTLSDYVFWWKVPCVLLKTKDGLRSDSIMTLYLTDSAPVVRARLAEALSLPRSS
jgi:hypothetical protein